MVAQAVTGTPGHINSLAIGAASMLEEFPVETLQPGDILITNDPYKTAGQLLDVTVLVPAWRNGRVIALFGSTIHHTDVGGYGIGAGGRDVFEEGLWIPICRLMRGENGASVRNDDVWRFIVQHGSRTAKAPMKKRNKIRFEVGKAMANLCRAKT